MLFSFRRHEQVIKHELMRESYVHVHSGRFIFTASFSIQFVCVCVCVFHLKIISVCILWPNMNGQLTTVVTEKNARTTKKVKQEEEFGAESLSIVGCRRQDISLATLSALPLSLVCVCNINPLVRLSFFLFAIQPRIGCCTKRNIPHCGANSLINWLYERHSHKSLPFFFCPLTISIDTIHARAVLLCRFP